MEILKTRKAYGIVLQERWSMDRVRNFCIEHDYYTCGDNDSYSKMLWYVEEHSKNPTIDDLYTVAMDIMKHSDLGDSYEITTMLYYLQNECIKTFYYTLDEIDD